MSLKLWKCPRCGEEFKTKKDSPSHCDGVLAEVLITPPSTKFLQKIDPEKGKSALVNQEAILKERARNHSRDNDLDDLILNNERDLAYQNGWLKKDGTRRRAIDDK